MGKKRDMVRARRGSKQKKSTKNKVANKKLNNLAKSGKLHTIKSRKLLKEVSARADYMRKNVKSFSTDKAAKEAPVDAGDDDDIPIEEADFEYYSNKDRHRYISTDTNLLELNHVINRKKEALAQKRLKYLLPIKGKDGIREQNVEMSDVEDIEEADGAKSLELDSKQKKSDKLVNGDTEQEIDFNELKEKVASLCQKAVGSSTLGSSSLNNLLRLLDDVGRKAATYDNSVLAIKIVLLSLLEVFKDVLPDYRLNVHTNPKPNVKFSKEVMITKENEALLLSQYGRFLIFCEKLIAKKVLGVTSNETTSTVPVNIPKEQKLDVQLVALKCYCELLLEKGHFNYRTNLIAVLAKFAVFGHPLISTMICEYFKRLFVSDRFTETTLEVVRLIGKLIKKNDFNVHPRVTDIFLALKILSIDKGSCEVGKKSDRTKEVMKSRRERKRTKHAKHLTRQLESAAVTINEDRKQKVQTEIVNNVFLTYFRVLKSAPHSSLLSSVLDGLAKFAHLISVDYFEDLFAILLRLVTEGNLQLKESLNCVLCAFTILYGQGSSLNIDPARFYGTLYLAIQHFQLNDLNSDQLPIALECLEMMLRRHKNLISQARMLAYVKRIATTALHSHQDGMLAWLSVCRTLVNSFSACKSLLDCDTHDNGLYDPLTDDPDHCFASATSLWELNLLSRHPHPYVQMFSRHLAAQLPSTGKNSLPMEFARSAAIELLEKFSIEQMQFNPDVPAMPKVSGKKSVKRKHSEQVFFDIKDSELESLCSGHFNKLPKTVCNVTKETYSMLSMQS